jgi:hypothetical protein
MTLTFEKLFRAFIPPVSKENSIPGSRRCLSEASLTADTRKTLSVTGPGSAGSTVASNSVHDINNLVTSNVAKIVTCPLY